MAQRVTVWDWSLKFVGDPDSWAARGQRIFKFLHDSGMTEQSRVLELGCGNLSQGKPLIEFLAPGHYTGIEPNGWLVEAALDRFPALEHKTPQFLWRSDFSAATLRSEFDFVIAHSVLSHCAHWQLDQMLTNVREVVHEGAVFLCSFRRGEQNTFAEEWVYPGVALFRLETIEATGLHTGWYVELKPEFRAALPEVAPNDTHDWLRLTAVPSAAELNDRRMAEEDRFKEEKEQRDAVEAARVEAARAEDEAFVAEAEE